MANRHDSGTATWSDTGSHEEPPEARAGVEVHEIDGEALLFDPSSGNTHRLNATALAIWRLCDGRHGLADIAETIVQRYVVEDEVACAQVARTLRTLRDCGLLSVPRCVTPIEAG